MSENNFFEVEGHYDIRIQNPHHQLKILTVIMYTNAHVHKRKKKEI